MRIKINLDIDFKEDCTEYIPDYIFDLIRNTLWDNSLDTEKFEINDIDYELEE